LVAPGCAVVTELASQNDVAVGLNKLAAVVVVAASGSIIIGSKVDEKA